MEGGPVCAGAGELEHFRRVYGGCGVVGHLGVAWGVG